MTYQSRLWRRGGRDDPGRSRGRGYVV